MGSDSVTTLLAKNADVLVTMDGERRELRDAGLFARDGMIEQVGPSSELPETPIQCSTCPGRLSCQD
jgi:cytosine/adenosine deaminase-related metal-dependent hydrolase